MPFDKLNVRWLIRRDMPYVLDIEQKAFEYGWTDKDFLSALKQRNCIGMVAEYVHEVVGFMVYELQNFAVRDDRQRQGVGSAMLNRLVDKLSLQRRSQIRLHVRESNLAAQQFFQACGFKAVQVCDDFYQHDGVVEAAYEMRYFVEGIEPESPWSPKNRISEYI